MWNVVRWLRLTWCHFIPSLLYLALSKLPVALLCPFSHLIFKILHTPKCQIILASVNWLWNESIPSLETAVAATSPQEATERLMWGVSCVSWIALSSVTLSLSPSCDSLLLPSVCVKWPVEIFGGAVELCHLSLLILKMCIPLWLHLTQIASKIKILINFSSAPQRLVWFHHVQWSTSSHFVLSDWPMLSLPYLVFGVCCLKYQSQIIRQDLRPHFCL